MCKIFHFIPLLNFTLSATLNKGSVVERANSKIHASFSPIAKNISKEIGTVSFYF